VTESAKVVTRGWVDMLIGTILLAGALLALWLPAYLDTYDTWGVQIKCGNGYYSQLDSQIMPATTDNQDQARQSALATYYAGRCKSALAHRRAWAIPIAAVGALIVVPELVAWARGGTRSLAATTNESWTEPADLALHDAALLDRRYRPHRTRRSDTTL
jgi:hypothetical protein